MSDYFTNVRTKATKNIKFAGKKGTRKNTVHFQKRNLKMIEPLDKSFEKPSWNETSII